jgi:hypothetical protein
VRVAERLVEVGEQVVRVFDPGREAQQVRRAGRAGPSIEARCSIRLSTPPSEVARFQSRTRGRGDRRALAAAHLDDSM